MQNAALNFRQIQNSALTVEKKVEIPKDGFLFGMWTADKSRSQILHALRSKEGRRTRYILRDCCFSTAVICVVYVPYKHDKREAALKIPMIGCSVLLSCCAGMCVLQTVYKNSGENTVYFLYLVQAVILAVFIVLELALSGSNKYIKRSSGKRAEFNTRF